MVQVLPARPAGSRRGVSVEPAPGAETSPHHRACSGKPPRAAPPSPTPERQTGGERRTGGDKLSLKTRFGSDARIGVQNTHNLNLDQFNLIILAFKD